MPNGLCICMLRCIQYCSFAPEWKYWSLLVMYMYVCIYVNVYVRMYVCMYVCMYIYMYVCMHACMYVCMHVCVCINVCIYQLLHTSGDIFTHVYMHVRLNRTDIFSILSIQPKHMHVRMHVLSCTY